MHLSAGTNPYTRSASPSLLASVYGLGTGFGGASGSSAALLAPRSVSETAFELFHTELVEAVRRQVEPRYYPAAELTAKQQLLQYPPAPTAKQVAAKAKAAKAREAKDKEKQ